MGEQKINCSKFQEKEPAIKKITKEINQARGKEKLKMAEKLRAEVEPLLTCADYDSKSVECHNCRLICQTREKTAETIIKVLSSLS